MLFVAVATLVGCKKDEESSILINATSTIEDNQMSSILKHNYIDANIAFIPANEFPVSHNKEIVQGLISNAKYKSVNGYQYKEYIPKGEYVVLMQVSDGIYSSLSSVYTFKKVSTLNEKGSFNNVMVFSIKRDGDYQVWVDKYKD
ncbi:hypothetical protein CLV99_1021 [Sphingobacterium yanglingense]|uniref:Uncharacterized protein n=2 Tax=Sphingobacterium yanglingense TaxID=1437280 RepID=A0A4R6WSA6_9SPHI|nr:hypothetical protein CLV99_1021 [Sphingobacterium yanglingense]